MEMDQITQFFKWASLISFFFLIFMAVIVPVAGPWAQKIHLKLYKISEKEFHLAVYYYMAAFKVLAIVFFWIPYLSLLAIS